MPVGILGGPRCASQDAREFLYAGEFLLVREGVLNADHAAEPICATTIREACGGQNSRITALVPAEGAWRLRASTGSRLNSRVPRPPYELSERWHFSLV